MIDLTARIDIVTGYRPGMIGRITQMHGEYYAKHYEFGHFREQSGQRAGGVFRSS